MAKTLYNINVGLLVLPDGTVVHPGTSVDLPEELEGNLGIASWIEDKLASFSPSAVEEVKDVSAQLEEAKSENEAMAAKIAELEAFKAAAEAKAAVEAKK